MGALGGTLRDKDWQRRVLDYMILAASLDKEFAQTPCRKVATFARDDRKLTETVESGLKLKQGGKRNQIPGWWPPYLLLRYAGFMRQGEGDYEERNRAAIGRLIEIFEDVIGRPIEPKTMHD